jgi:hypothetical protein
MLISLLFLLASDPSAAPQAQGSTASFTPRAETEVEDSAVPLDWAGPGARKPGADPSVRNFDPTKSIFGEANMCVVIQGQPVPACAQGPREGKPQRVFATVCGDEAESWQFRQRSTPSSRANPTRATERAINPYNTTAKRNPVDGSGS